eukprot:CAMPEP_0172763566 /NCGR_PEP_ID=MMETSP1074-20121228/175580_1 /TAXON_ID=2916 /ORGANISM="Ceratium fusus, Strain PA161109" /LENGTH=44 /DNA_ID= /DNA_START= /DNA_END= /DNA_ORIENTATION=
MNVLLSWKLQGVLSFCALMSMPMRATVGIPHGPPGRSCSLPHLT